MYNVIIGTGEPSTSVKMQAVNFDTYSEVEQAAIKLAQAYFKSKDLIVVYDGDLDYSVYEVAEPIGKIKIKVIKGT